MIIIQVLVFFFTLYIIFNANTIKNNIKGHELPYHMYTSPYETANQ